MSLGPGLIAAAKADTISIASWQIGMHGFTAFSNFYVFRHVLGARREVNGS
ncbi:hypothetical protein ACRAVF_14440 [Bradyrhizobium oligotrophicum S58]